MKQFSYVLTNENAAHARGVGALTREAARFVSRIQVASGSGSAMLGDGHAVNALHMHSGSQVTVIVEGTDEEAAIAAMQDYFVSNL